jgi:beta-lactamase class A
VGTKLTLAEAVQEMLVNSDNTSYEMIMRTVPNKALLNVFSFLDIPYDNSVNPTVTAKNYTSVLKNLYFSSFLSHDDSQAILSLLASSSFDQGLRSYIPESIPIAHKWGINQKVGVFSDCGIIYYPNDPYLLCIMQRYTPHAPDITALRTISDKVYQYIDQQQE